MKTYVVLLRGINVGGHNKIKMADLRTTLEKHSFEAVKTYIQSGNIVLKSNIDSTESVNAKVHEILLEEYGYDIAVMSFLKEDWVEKVSNNPFLPERAEEMKFLHMTMLRDQPKEGSESALQKLINGQEAFKIIGNDIYIYCPHGFARTKFSSNNIERACGTKSTTRNWRTTLKINSILEDY